MWERKISVIIPVYNMERFLERCLDSVLQQTYSNLEIILVDDGSTDSSGVVCEEYVKRDPRIQVIHQKNQGLGAARNTGLKHAAGELISFVDSDDYLDLCAYEKLCAYMETNESDICFFGHYRVNDSHITRFSTPPEKLFFSGKEEILGEFWQKNVVGEKSGDGFTGFSVCCALYKASMIQDRPILFYSEREVLSEDILFNLEACANAKRVSVFPEYLYYYYTRGGSLTRKYRKDRFEAALGMDQVLKQLAEEYQIADWVQMGIVFCFRMNLIVCLKQEAVFAKQNGYKNALENIRAIGMCPETQQNIKNSNMEGIKRRILFKALQWKRWRLVYCLASLWVYLEKNIKS